MNDIVEVMYDVDGYEVLSDIGFVDICRAIKTKSMKKYVVYFSSGSIIECADKHIFIKHDGNEVFCKDIEIGELVLSTDGIDEVYDIIETDEYDNMYDLTLSNHHLFYTNGILSHNSQTMANFAARQVFHGHNVVLMTLEMSEDAFAQRFDGIYSGLNINRMYIYEDLQKKLIRELYDLKKNPDIGNLYIKQFPTGEASTTDFRAYLRELKIRGVEPDIVYVDYINLMKSSKNFGDNMYSRVKGVSEELRALSFEFEVPVVSVSQLNREGSFVGFEELDFTYISESVGVPATADFMSIYGTDEESMIYESEMHYKIVKNRLGGMVGDSNKMYIDKKSLKMYDGNELDDWIRDAQKSGDERNVVSRS